MTMTRQSIDAFTRATTSHAFVLTLSRYQVAGLVCLRDRVSYDHVHQGTLNSLMNKGLIEQFEYSVGPKASDGFISFSYRLTEIGKLVVKLCEYAGLADPEPVAVRRPGL